MFSNTSTNTDDFSSSSGSSISTENSTTIFSDSSRYLNDQTNSNESEKSKNHFHSTPCNIYPKYNIILITFVSIILIIFLIIIIVNIFLFTLILSTMKIIKDVEQNEYPYFFMYYDRKNNKTYEYGIFEKRKIQGYQFSDENGGGYMYPITIRDNNINEDLLKEYRIEGECFCCFECEEDVNCNNIDDDEKYYCVENTCVECRDDKDCKIGFCNFNGKCLNSDEFYCHSNDDCKREEVCNHRNGKCIKTECVYDDECDGKNQICEGYECINGCRNDYDCNKKGEVCLMGKCTFGCRDDYDCTEDLDSFCLNNRCENVGESCFDDNECKNDGYYCDLEYFVCLPNNRRMNLYNNRRNEEAAGVCSLYGMITLFIMAASYHPIKTIANLEFNDECSKRCSEKSKYSINGNLIYIEGREKKYNINKMKHSECVGQCKEFSLVKNPEAREHSKKNCPFKELRSIVSIEAKIEHLADHIYSDCITVATDIFKGLLASYCKQFKFNYKYPYFRWGKTHFRLINGRSCSADTSSIKCRCF